MRHLFEGWHADSLGEGRTATFGEDVELGAYGVDPGGTTEPGLNTDTVVTDAPVLYFRHMQVESSAHDEWTVRGERYRQDGKALIWQRNGRVAGTVIRLKRRAG